MQQIERPINYFDRLIEDRFHFFFYIGLFEPGHMKYEVDRLKDPAGEPSIEEMTEMAIKILSKNPKGYFLFVEGKNIGGNELVAQ